MPSSIEQRAAGVQAIVFDVDGVLTRGDVTYGPGGEWKSFNVRDGHGIVMARRAGLKVALLSARSSEPVQRRAQELGVDLLVEGHKNKGEGIRDLLAQLSVRPENACFVGDDLVDLPAMNEVGFPVAVANAVAEVKALAAWVTSQQGGEGAAREVVEFILRAQGRWAPLVKAYGEGR